MRSRLFKILPWSWALVWFMTVISVNGTMLAIWIFTLLVLLTIIYRKPRFLKQHLGVTIIPSLLFFWYLVSWIVNGLPGNGYEEIVAKSALFLLPLLLLLSHKLKGMNMLWAMRGFIVALIISGIHLFIRALLMAAGGAGIEEFTYHGFTAPYELGAIYYSWYLSIAVLYLMFGKPDSLLLKHRHYLILFFLLLIMASSSKLFVLLMVPTTVGYFIFSFRASKLQWLALITLALIILGGALPVINRIQEISAIESKVVYLDEYSYDTPLNGITLRLIQWRFGLEILQEGDMFLFGAGPGNGQKLLDEKYKAYGLYTGNEEFGDCGYIGYNFHNQYIESLVETGIPGLLLLILLLIGVVFIYKKLLIFPFTVIMLTIIFSMFESVLERQAGIIVFSMMIALLRTNDCTSNLNERHNKYGYH